MRYRRCLAGESIKAAIPGHPKRMGRESPAFGESIKAAIPGHPKPPVLGVESAGGVYQSCHSRPSKAERSASCSRHRSLSKLPFPAIQSREHRQGSRHPESIKAAIPGHPKRKQRAQPSLGRVYQSCHSRPSKASSVGGVPSVASLSKLPFPAIQSRKRCATRAVWESIKAAIPGHPKLLRDRPPERD